MRRRRSGFTLIEVLIAIVLLAAGLVAVSAAFLSALVSNQKAENLRIANDAVEKKMEAVRAAPFSALNNSQFPSPFDIYDPKSTALPPLKIGSGTIKFSGWPAGSSTPGLLKVEVTGQVGGTRATQASSRAETVIGDSF